VTQTLSELFALPPHADGGSTVEVDLPSSCRDGCGRPTHSNEGVPTLHLDTSLPLCDRPVAWSLRPAATAVKQWRWDTAATCAVRLCNGSISLPAGGQLVFGRSGCDMRDVELAPEPGSGTAEGVPC
jgi:hypothetical protein